MVLLLSFEGCVGGVYIVLLVGDASIAASTICLAGAALYLFAILDGPATPDFVALSGSAASLPASLIDC